MPTVPRLTAPSVSLNPLAPAPAEHTATAADFGGIQAQQNKALGGALGQVAETAAYIQDQEDLHNVLQAETQAKSRAAQTQTELMQRQGQNAWGVTKDADKAWNEMYKEVDGSLKTPRQKRMLSERLANARLSYDQTISGHEASQRRVALEKDAAASILSSTNFAAVNASNAAAVAESKDDIRRQSATVAHMSGWGPERSRLELENNLINFHTQVLQQLARDNPQAAEEYFKQNKKELGTNADVMEGLVGTARRRALAQQVGDEVMAKKMTEADAMAHVRKTYKDKPEERAAIELEVKSRFGENDALRERAQRTAADSAWKTLETTGRFSDIPADVIQALDGKDLEALRARAGQPGGPDNTSWNKYYELRDLALSKPEEFAKLDLRREQGLRQEHRERLAELQKGAATKTPAYLKAATTEQLLGAAYNSLGMRDDDRSEETLKRKGGFTDEVYRRITVAQSVLKRDLSTKEEQDIIDEVAIKGSVYKWWRPNPEKFVFELSQDELNKFTPENMPTTLRNGLTEAIKRSRGPDSGQPTEDEVNAAFRLLVQRERERLGRGGIKR